MMLYSSLRTRIRSSLRDYDQIQAVAVILIYIQIGCALVESLGTLYNGVLLINLPIALFALVAIESSSQRLGRTYAVFFAALSCLISRGSFSSPNRYARLLFCLVSHLDHK
ncbi:hypothetical protein NE237_010632 [Protea cynaroides]|uniref:Uncharacterized protein n=1 Tax=Protea cynaroides TaxID=273540 RepID=A0A9Q0KZP7_9MAGN|nr:hypothetical protein NE237_010632 [Protea cynaroides]